MKVLFELRHDKQDKAGTVPVYVSAYFDGLRLRCSTKERCEPRQWNERDQEFRRSFAGYHSANEGLKALERRLEDRYRDLRADNVAPTVALLREVVNPAAVVVPEEPTLLARFAAFREVLVGRGYAFHTLRHYKTAYNHLTAFLEKTRRKGLLLAGYTPAVHDDFVRYLRTTCGLSANGAYTMLKDLKTFLRHAQDERGLTLGLELTRLEVRYTEQAKAYLTGADLAALVAVSLPKTLEPARDVFLFCCYTGLRYSDVAALHAGNVHGLGVDGTGERVLRLVQTKTRATVSIYLSRLAAQILDRYAGPERAHAGARLLPVLANQPMNRYLKKIGQLAGLTRLVEVVSTAGGQVVKQAVPLHELVTMHTARHTFAVQSLLRGMPVTVLQRVMGHAKIQNTMRYAQVVEELQHQAMRAAWDGPSGLDAGPAPEEAVCTVMAA
ncbi:site-specific integrase [Hymenobacter psychrophilus]|uniref:Site-specific recombinase XerD n=1 Tax=Hymenobacter psychrophilus TaxID=651662 RepID=A0A1H3IS68_9BACT|nr:site-specific integrase [Hymenobacter psychrophilus]SDY30521.1 Site-specific recombinase XerD [Hymenobacter psychrophilus]